MMLKLVIALSLLMLIPTPNYATPGRLSYQDSQLHWFITADYQSMTEEDSDLAMLQQTTTAVHRWITTVGLQVPWQDFRLTLRFPWMLTKQSTDGQYWNEQWHSIGNHQSESSLQSPNITLGWEGHLPSGKLHLSASRNFVPGPVNLAASWQQIYDPILFSVSSGLNIEHKELSWHNRGEVLLAANERWAIGGGLTTTGRHIGLEPKVVYNLPHSTIEVAANYNTTTAQVNLSLTYSIRP